MKQIKQIKLKLVKIKTPNIDKFMEKTNDEICEEIEDQEFKWGEERASEEYPLGGSLERYDIERDKQL
jgi:hypothetical protein